MRQGPAKLDILLLGEHVLRALRKVPHVVERLIRGRHRPEPVILDRPVSRDVSRGGMAKSGLTRSMRWEVEFSFVSF
jgi:hypothetical protein